MTIDSLGRAAAFSVLAGIILATAISLNARQTPSMQTAGTREPVIPSDALGAELLRCRHIAPNAAPDPACKAAWAENRTRFFASGRSRQGRAIDQFPATGERTPFVQFDGESPIHTPQPPVAPDANPLFGQSAN